MKNARWIGLALLALAPLAGMGEYPLHLLILCLLWAFVYTGWAVMGRLGMVSLGHGAFLGVGAYVVVMGWNHFHLSPWLGIPLALVATALLAFLIGYPCFRFKIVGHYFALVTLALSEVVRLIIIALRDYTGGSLGVTPKTALVKTSDDLFKELLGFFQRSFQTLDLGHIPDALHDVDDLAALVKNRREHPVFPTFPAPGVRYLPED